MRVKWVSTCEVLYLESLVCVCVCVHGGVCVCVHACLSTSFISRVHINISKYYFCTVLRHICESAGAVLAYLAGLLPGLANEEVCVAQCQAHGGPPIMFVEWMRAKCSSLNVFYKCFILMISGSFHKGGSAKEVHRVAARAQAQWLLTMLNKTDSNQSIRCHWNGASVQQNGIRAGREPGPRFGSQSKPYLFLAPSLPPRLGGSGFWKSFRVFHRFGPQMLERLLQTR